MVVHLSNSDCKVKLKNKLAAIKLSHKEKRTC